MKLSNFGSSSIYCSSTVPESFDSSIEFVLQKMPIIPKTVRYRHYACIKMGSQGVFFAQFKIGVGCALLINWLQTWHLVYNYYLYGAIFNMENWA